MQPLSAGKWRAEFAQYLKDKHVYVIPDQDDAGRKHADDVARSLVGVARSIMIADLPEGAKDIADLAQANGQVFSEQLSALLREARPFELPSSEAPPVNDEDDPRDYSREQSESSNSQNPPRDEEKNRGIHYTVRSPLEILGMQFEAGDLVLENGYLEKGSPSAWCGQGGIGKSRLVLQLAIACALGHDFFGWKTRGENLKWLFLQTENGNLRLQADLVAMMCNLTLIERQRVDQAIKIHTLENDDDGFMHLSNDKVVAGIEALTRETTPDIVVFDPLRDFNIGDLNSDADMAATLSTIGRVTRNGNPKRIPLIIHHARTGKAGIAKVVGWDRSDFGRNSKVLMSGLALKSTSRRMIRTPTTYFLSRLASATTRLSSKCSPSNSIL